MLMLELAGSGRQVAAIYVLVESDPACIVPANCIAHKLASQLSRSGYQPDVASLI